jgi:hypothetical protein
VGTNTPQLATTEFVLANKGGAGSVTSASVVTANGLAGTVATPNTTPDITLKTTLSGMLKGNATALLAAVAGTDYLAPSNFTYSNNSNGYVKFPGGLIIQWGQTYGSTSGYVTVNFPIAFPVAVLKVVGSTASGDSTGVFVMFGASMSKTSFPTICTGASGFAANVFHWITIGY